MQRLLTFVLLALTIISLTPSYAQDGGTEIESGDTITGIVTATETEFVYTFDAEADDAVTITATAADPDELVLSVGLLDSEGHELERSNRGLIEDLLLENAGTYQIVVEAVIGEGSFTLSLRKKATSEDDPSVIFFEDFDDNSAGWETLDQPGYVRSLIADGMATIDYVPREVGSGWYITPGFEDWDLAPIVDEDYHYEFEISNVTSSVNRYSIGIFFAVTEGYESYRYITINQDGLLTFYRNSEVSDLTFAEEEIYVPRVDFTDGTHTIGIVVNENLYTFLVDGEILYQFEDDFSFDLEGTIGFMLSANTDSRGTLHAEFDNVAIRHIAPELERSVREFEVGCIVEAQRNAVSLSGGTWVAIVGFVVTLSSRLPGAVACRKRKANRSYTGFDISGLLRRTT